MNQTSKRRVRLSSAIAVAACSVIGAEIHAQVIRAFGEAEGFGAVSVGARANPTVYHVTNLNNSGAGSFRDAVSVANRIIVFDVSGVINLTSEVGCQSNLTIAGQTAPGGGIIITGNEVSFGGRSNIIARHLRFRPGDSSPSGAHCVNLYNTNNAILDHVSLEYGKWNNIGGVTDNGNASQVTIQHSLVANPIGQQFAAHTESLNGAWTWSHNIIANSHNRMPMAKVDTIFKNNVVYNYGAGYTVSNTSGYFSHDIVNNYFIVGPGTTSNGNAFYQMNSRQSIWSSGNMRDTDKDATLDGGLINPGSVVALTGPWSPVTTELPLLSSAAAAFDYATQYAGASLTRDAVDAMVIGQVQSLGSLGAGYTVGTSGPNSGMYNSANSSGITNTGLGSIAYTTRPAGFDADNDGIADTWELAHGLSPSTASDALLFNPVGYRMIEQYINELGAVSNTRTLATTGGSWTSAAAWAGSVSPLPTDYVIVRGSGGTPASVTVSSDTAFAMSLRVGGGTSPTGDTLHVTGGKLDVYDQIMLGEFNHATLNLSGGLVEAYNIILGNTVYSPTPATFTGTINLSGGTLSAANMAQGGGTPGVWDAGGQINFTGGTLKAFAPVSTFKVPMTVSGAGGTIDTAGNTLTYSGSISGPGGLTKATAGRLVLSGANTFTGPITVSAGVLTLTALNNSGTAGPMGSATSAAANLVLAGGTLAYAGTTTTSTDRLLTFTPAGGTLDSGPGGAGQWQFTNKGDFIASGTGNRTLILTGSAATSDLYAGITDPVSGKTSLLKSGTGRWVLTASNNPRSYSGDTTITAGTLMSNSDNVLPFGPDKGNLVVTAGTFEMNGRNLAINGLAGAGLINNRSNSRTLTLGCGDASAIFSGTLSNIPLSTTSTLHVIKVGTGTQTFTGTVSYIGNTTVTAGKLVYAIPLRTPGGTLSATGGLVTLEAAATTSANTIAGEFAGITTSGGVIRIAPTDRSTNVPRLLIAGGIAASTGLIDLTNNDALFRNTTETDVRIAVASWWNGGLRNGSGLGSSFSTTDVLTTLAVVSAGSSTSFDGISLVASDVLVKYTYLGDTNLSGKVDGTDLSNLVAGIRGGLTGWANGDNNYDGIVDGNDLANLLLALRLQGAPLSSGEAGGGNPSAGGAVPEPHTLGLLGVSCVLLSGARRHKMRP